MALEAWGAPPRSTGGRPVGSCHLHPSPALKCHETPPDRPLVSRLQGQRQCTRDRTNPFQLDNGPPSLGFTPTLQEIGDVLRQLLYLAKFTHGSVSMCRCTAGQRIDVQRRPRPTSRRLFETLYLLQKFATGRPPETRVGLRVALFAAEPPARSQHGCSYCLRTWGCRQSGRRSRPPSRADPSAIVNCQSSPCATCV